MSIKLSTSHSSFGCGSSEVSRSAWRTVYPALAALLFVALFLRLYRLNEGLWLDEIITYVKYARLSIGEIITTYDSENQHFLYSLLARASLLLFGDSAWALRLPAALFGVGSIWAVYLVGAELTHPKEVTARREAFLAAALLTFSYHHLWFSQNARGYSGLLFWTMISSWFLLRALRENRPQLWIGYALSAALGIYTHMTMAFVVAGQFLVFLIDWAYSFLKPRSSLLNGLQFNQASQDPLRKPGRSFLGSQAWIGLVLGFGLAGLLALILHLPALSGITATVGGTEKSVVTAWKSPLWTALEIARA